MTTQLRRVQEMTNAHVMGPRLRAGVATDGDVDHRRESERRPASPHLARRDRKHPLDQVRVSLGARTSQMFVELVHAPTP